MKITPLQDIQELYQEAIYLRRKLHKIPEMDFQEFKTSKFISNYLKNLGLEVQENIAGTGVIAYLPGIKGKKTYAFRADMDALPVTERTRVDFASIHHGKMHACGHDGHMTILLLLAKVLCKNKKTLQDNLLFIFQPGEEGPGGALPMIQEGILDQYHVDSIFGLHIYPEIEQGKIGCCPGPMMAQNGEFDIIIKGKSGHGARPQEGIDSIVMASQLIAALQSIISRNINPIEGGVVTVGTIKGGEARNIIAKEVLLEGTLRAFKEEIYEDIKERLNKNAQGVAMAHESIIDVCIRDMYPPVNNHEKLFKYFKRAIPEENLQIIDPLMISEDFSYYQKEIPGLFFLLGSQNHGKGYIHGLHSNQFNFDEKILLIGVEAFYRILKIMGGIE